MINKPEPGQMLHSERSRMVLVKLIDIAQATRQSNIKSLDAIGRMKGIEYLGAKMSVESEYVRMCAEAHLKAFEIDREERFLAEKIKIIYDS